MYKIGSSLEFMNNEWQFLKDDLYKSDNRFDDVSQYIERYEFLKKFDDVFQYSKKFLEIPLCDIKRMYRGVPKKVDLKNYGRMVPNAEFSNRHNRMNPPGRVFIYLGVMPTQKGNSEDIEKNFIINTIAKELRAVKGQDLTICRFESNTQKKIIDLTGDSTLPLIESEVDKLIDKKIKSLARVRSGKVKVEPYVHEILTKLYINIFNNDNIFKPIEIDEERAYEYAPFQLIASYIEQNGYAGIKYRSTVDRKGTNLVLFNTEDVTLIPETMEHIIYSI